MDTLSYQSKLVSADEARRTGCFTTLPIRIHPRDDVADAASRRFVREWVREIGDGREQHTYFSFSPAGNWSSLVYPEAIPERLGVLAYLSDLGLIRDDTGEGLSIDEAHAEHDKLYAALDPDDKRCLAPESRAMKTKKLVSQNTCNTAVITVGCCFWPMLQFSLGTMFSEAEHELVQPIIDAAIEGLLLANDYFRWGRRYRELQSGHSKRIAAEDEINCKIVKAERDFCQRRDELYRAQPDMSMKLRKWIF
ncbi:geranylgeranyl pyrophosphate synthase [Botryosphaeria dothidea]|uniref:Geranylgeranyl pyrophosphate synthase n=1 Tax=Botryosphaeria dothidea TaxID=55169 RepID=A0A8H4IMG6_9PEZI|nr:geranylgeranyl pyrophosphate synthase [Botryosphaeria dothidea]